MGMETHLRNLRKGDCFMFNREPYIVEKTYWEKHGILKLKIWVLKMKFDDNLWHTRDDLYVYKISKGLYDLLEINKES